MIGPEVVNGLIEIIVAGCVLLAIWKVMDRVDQDIDQDETKR